MDAGGREVWEAGCNRKDRNPMSTVTLGKRVEWTLIIWDFSVQENNHIHKSKDEIHLYSVYMSLTKWI